METRQLKYFLDVANCLNFTKAAQQNHIAQTAMSQNIISLENQLGFKLFHRNNRNVELTHMGMAFYREALQIMRAVERSESHMQSLISGNEGIIRIGFQGEHESRFLPQMIQKFRTRYPKVTPELIQSIPSDLERMLREDEVDIIFNIQYEETADDTEELFIETQPLCLVAPTGHPLSEEERISRAQLASEPMVFLNPTCSEDIYHRMIHESLQCGFTPNVVSFATSVYSLLLMVACGIGITVLPESCDTKQFDLHFVPLEENSSLNVVARWRSKNYNPLVPTFVNMLKETFPKK